MVLRVDTDDEVASKPAILQKALKRFKAATEAEAPQRQREVDDLRFQVPELQWDDDSKRLRGGDVIAGVPIPARPILSIPKLQQPIELVLNQERSAHLGVNIHPLSPDADEDTAKIFQGIYRAIERYSNAGTARSWAFNRAVQCGRGVYRINTVYDDDGPEPFDQVIRIERILHQNQVYFDPSSTKADFSDAEWAFVTAWIPLARFREMYPSKTEEAEDGADNLDFMDLEQSAPDWIRGEGDDKAILVAEHFYKEHETVKIVLLDDNSTAFEDEIPEGRTLHPDGRSREKDRVTVKWCKLTGVDVLEEAVWNGKYIPLIPVIGRELQPFDSERRYTGIIGPNKDAQKMYNFAASSLVEKAALEPKAPFMLTKDQVGNYQSWWQQANMRNFPYLLYDPVVGPNGELVPPPGRIQANTEGMGPSLMLLQEANGFLQGGTAFFDPSLGKSNTRHESGRAIQRLQDQGEQSNSHFLFNLADISMTHEARVVMDLIPKIYDRPGRLARILDAEDDTESVMLNAPYTKGPDGNPVAVVPGAPPPLVNGNPAAIKHYDLTKGVYSVSVSIGKSYNSKLQQGAEEMGEILQAQPNLMPVLGPLYFKYRDFPGAREIADLLGKIRDRQFPDLDADEDGQPSPEQMKAQMQALKQQLQIKDQQLKAAATALETDQAKQQATVQKTQIDSETTLNKAQMDNETKLALQSLEQKFDMAMEMLKHGHESKMEALKTQHEVALSAADAAHGADQATQEQEVTAATMLPPFTQSADQPLGEEDQF